VLAYRLITQSCDLSHAWDLLLLLLV
jgi:hypothetical protein